MSATEDMLRSAFTSSAEQLPISIDPWRASQRRVRRVRRRRVAVSALSALAVCAAGAAAFVVPGRLGYSDPLAGGPHRAPVAMTPFDPSLVHWTVLGVPTRAWISAALPLEGGEKHWVAWHPGDDPAIACTGIYTDGNRELDNPSCVRADPTVVGGTGDLANGYTDTTVVPASVDYVRAQHYDRTWADAYVIVVPGDALHVVVTLTTNSMTSCNVRELRGFNAAGRRVYQWGGGTQSCDDTRFGTPPGSPTTVHYG